MITVQLLQLISLVVQRPPGTCLTIFGVLQGGDLPLLKTLCGKDQPKTKWISEKQLEGEGLSSSVCKVAKLAAAQVGKEKKGIKRFFAVVAE